ncbi:putative filamentation protein [Aspergillus sclerotiicarbonarius CBS 121057]|uniref:Putative filamentation protein n=1 Tax=Aspergillus sclerotiicarbonarius (strain CBS 121057 / IBT 28362) TaxID=1448318 RepID=A0A319F3C5_ASPSB|nr:putative filamentation protein [Aspergillus sclerotiicarbonarius CBS 121057]
MTGRDSDKGHRYVTALDNARCQNKWDEVPELIRKVTKHAPQKTCFLEVASAEYQVASHLQKHPSTPRPASASGLHDLIPTLLSTVNRAEGPKQDVFQAQVCLGWVHWTVNELGLAASRFPHDFGETLNELEHAGEELSPWTKTCLVKACYLKGSAQRMTSDPYGALETLHSLAPWLTSQLQSSINTPQFIYWSEKLLAEAASLAGEEACKDIAVAGAQTIATALGFFRLWASHPQVKLVALPQGMLIDGSAEPVSRSPIWKSYYSLLSSILQQGLPYSPPVSGPEHPQLASEIRRVESLCEASVLRETEFPAADSTSPEIEAWVEQVIQNWEVLCGSNWTDEELGEGGQNSIGRNVLDVLYRAATKTYHSHLILRRLFHVHCALADYDLALKALDSYIEIVTSAKERAEKAAQYGDLENDGTLLRTVSEGVTMLSCFGSEKQAEKAKDLTSLLKEFSEKHVQDDEDGEQGMILIAPETSSTRSQAVSPSDIAAAYRGIGIGLANWAYWTPVNEDRDDIRAEAIDYLERSLAPELEDESNCSSLYTLAVLLAENRDLDGAIDYVKSALTSDAQHKMGQADFARERDLVPLWHLLALLLSAKQDFDIAERSCEAAFEQFPATVTSLAHSDRRPQKQNQSTQDQITGITHELIDKLRDREKERIIETRMTQLAFVELVEGPGAAVNHSEQLLSLFATLFHSLNPEGDEKGNTKTDHLVPPKSSAGTVKSLRGSIFGRHRGPRGPDRRAEFAQESKTESPYSASHGSSAITDSAPAIQVTDGEKPASNDSPAGQLRTRSSTLKRGEDAQNPVASYVNGDVGTHGPGAGDAMSGTPQQPGSSPDVVGVAVSEAAQSQSAKQPLRPMAHNMEHNQQPPPTGHSKQPPEQDTRLPTSYAFDSPTRAVTKVPPAQAQKHALCILVKVWLLIAGLYRRASSFEDAHEACEEAAKQVARVEALVASQEASARAFRERGWGIPKSTDELWADVNAERGLLSNAQARPHEAMEHFETALLHDADHPKATAGLSNLLLDIYDQKVPLQPPKRSLEAGISTLSVSSTSKSNKPSSEDDVKRSNQAGAPEAKPLADSDDEEPRLLNRIAARERAFGLLSGLTKRGSSWDNTEAWYALSRAYEAEGQIEKLKEVLWWCIELEDRRPIRHWSNIGSGIYVL